MGLYALFVYGTRSPSLTRCLLIGFDTSLVWLLVLSPHPSFVANNTCFYAMQRLGKKINFPHRCCSCSWGVSISTLTFIVASCVSAERSARALTRRKLYACLLYFSFRFTIVAGTLTDRFCFLLLLLLPLARIFFALKSGRLTPSLLLFFAS